MLQWEYTLGPHSKKSTHTENNPSHGSVITVPVKVYQAAFLMLVFPNIGIHQKIHSGGISWLLHNVSDTGDMDIYDIKSYLLQK